MNNLIERKHKFSVLQNLQVEKSMKRIIRNSTDFVVWNIAINKAYFTR